MTEPMNLQESQEIRENRRDPGNSAAVRDRRVDPELSPAARALVARIGGTPLVPLPSPRSSVRIHGKAEWMNPGGSVKDRTAWGIVRGALERGDLAVGRGDGARRGEGSGGVAAADRRLLDASSGNTAIAYATLGAALGIDVTICLPANASRERRLTLAAHGAEVLLTDEMEGTDGASERARQLAEARPGRYWYADQYSNPDNWRAHYEGTAEEIWAQTEGTVTHLVAGLGTTGTLVGTGRRLRELNPGLRVVAVQPATALHGLEGLKHLPTNRRPAIWDPTVADEHRSIRTEAAREAATDLARGTGYFVGPSAGAALVAARRVASGLEEGTVVTILPDGGERYLSEAWWSTDERSFASVPVATSVPLEGAGAGSTASADVSLVVPDRVFAEIREQLEAAHPAEGCGVLVGQADGRERRVERAVPARNRSSGRNDRYEIDPETLRDLMELEDAGGPRVLGFYHSHPDAEPVPSATDRERSWPWYVYLIVRVDGREAAHGDAGRDADEVPDEGAQASREGRVWTFGPDGEPTEGTLEIVDARGEGPWPK
ncbi:MAG: pyridoxal-phosphate dependent enzyme [Gemmatimonadota bacterium]